ncbi:MAG TPA: hypothetical protein VG961_08560 [Ignavibacteria bacterium]|nr:hypothetical protein [Ignavibacteria bacterium]
MKYILLLLLVSIISIISSCSDDTTTNNPGVPPGTVMYSADSISVWLSSTGFARDSVYYSTSETGSVKVEFTIQSNVDTPSAYGKFGFYTNATPVVPYYPDIYAPRDEPFSTNLSFASGSTYFAFMVQLNNYLPTFPRYVRLKSVKVTKQ